MSCGATARSEFLELWRGGLSKDGHPPQDEWGGESANFKNVGVPLSIGAQMIAGGELETSGVMPPEQVLPVEPFFSALAERGITVEWTVEKVS
ncbi:MAG: hypothetical protein BMS9Abin28_1082 [Anaerolineae bacterium]|nr:MAG: hypothetical protein BMS9Abin28_1082 [Anaerolineae bacterium]